MSQFLLIDRMVKKMKSIADVEPSLDEALEKHQKAQEQVKLMEQVIASKHKNLQEIINRLKKED